MCIRDRENRRFYDVRRWGIYEETEQEPIRGMNPDGATKETYYQRVIPSSSSFLTRVVDKRLSLIHISLTLYKDVTFFTDVTITFLFREVPVKLLLRLLQVFFLHIHLRQNTQGPMFSTIFQ